MADDLEPLRTVWEDKKLTYDILLVKYFGAGSRLNVEMPEEVARPEFSRLFEQALLDERVAWQRYTAARDRINRRI